MVKGAKFTIDFPIVKDIVEEEEIKIERPKKSEGVKSVLVVEDEESLRDFCIKVNFFATITEKEMTATNISVLYHCSR